MKKMIFFILFALFFSGCHWRMRITDPFLTPRGQHVRPHLHHPHHPHPKIIVIKKKPKVIIIKKNPSKKKCYKKHPHSNILYCK